MKANKKNLIKALKMSAEAHKVEYNEFFDFFKGDEPALKSQSIPVCSDVRSIARAFFGDDAVVSCDDYIGYTVVIPGRYLKQVNESLLAMALPAGSMEKFK